MCGKKSNKRRQKKKKLICFFQLAALVVAKECERRRRIKAANLIKRNWKAVQLNPKLIVYAVDPNAFASDGVESAMDIIANDKNDRESLKMLAKINHLKVFNTLIYGYYKDYIHKDK